MFSLLFIMLAAACNAVMDKVKDHFDKSIFSNMDKQFWNPEISWKNKYINLDPAQGFVKKPFYTSYSDGWHLFKTMMIVFLCLAISLYTPFSAWVFGIEQNVLTILVDFVLLGTLWNVTFSFFYDKKLAKKK
jgi:hypothetical protein